MIPVVPETADEVIKTLTQLQEWAGFTIKKSLAVLNLPTRTYHRWISLSDKKPRPEGFPNGHGILAEEREKRGLQTPEPHGGRRTAGV